MAQTKVKKNFAGFDWELMIPSNIDTEINENRDWEPNVSNWIRSNLKEGDFAIDVGANIGWFTLLMAKAVGESGLVYAFEPELSFYNRLEQHVRNNNLQRVCLRREAVGDYNDIGYLIKNIGPYFSSARTVKDIPTGDIRFQKVEVVTLDYFWHQKRLDLIKIDVDGFEMRILKGAEQTIKKFWPKIVMEIADPGPVAFLENLGYGISRERGAKNTTPITSAMVPGILNPGMPTINIYAVKS